MIEVSLAVLTCHVPDDGVWAASRVFRRHASPCAAGGWQGTKDEMWLRTGAGGQGVAAGNVGRRSGFHSGSTPTKWLMWGSSLSSDEAQLNNAIVGQVDCAMSSHR